MEGKTETLFFQWTDTGFALEQILADYVAEAASNLPIPKVMRWGGGEAQFVRPVHGLVMLHGSHVVPGTVLGLVSGNQTSGHRFMGKSGIVLDDVSQYKTRLLDEGMVMVDFGARRSEIERQLKAEARRQRGNLGQYEDLLDEVTALVEYPSIYVASFDAEFLQVPQECLILTMRQNQKYFPLFASGGKLLPKFLIVSNLRVDDPRPI